MPKELPIKLVQSTFWVCLLHTNASSNSSTACQLRLATPHSTRHLHLLALSICHSRIDHPVAFPGTSDHGSSLHGPLHARPASLAPSPGVPKIAAPEVVRISAPVCAYDCSLPTQQPTRNGMDRRATRTGRRSEKGRRFAYCLWSRRERDLRVEQATGPPKQDIRACAEDIGALASRFSIARYACINNIRERRSNIYTRAV